MGRPKIIEQDASLFGEKVATETKPKTIAAKASKPAPKAKNAVASKPQSRDVAVHRPAPPPKQKSILQIIGDAAADPAVQPDKMRALLDMQKEIMAEEARIAFTQDFINLQAELPIINAKGRIEIEAKKPGGKRQDTPYATFNEINRVTKPILQRHGFVMWSAPDLGPEGRIIMRVYLDHVRGHGKSCAIPLPLETSGSKNNVQGVGSSISYGKRYGAIALLNLISEAKEDRDLDGNDPKKVEKAEEHLTPKQVKDLSAAIEDCGVGVDIFLNKYEIEAIEYLPPKLYVEATTACANFKMNKMKAAAEQRTHG